MLVVSSLLHLPDTFKRQLFFSFIVKDVPHARKYYYSWLREREVYINLFSFCLRYLFMLCYEFVWSFKDSKKKSFKMFFSLRKSIILTVATIKGKQFQRVYSENTGKLFIVNTFYRQKTFEKYIKFHYINGT